MEFLSNLHTHSQYSDGKNPLEDYIRTAIDKGFVSLGFSEHGVARYDACEVTAEKMPYYLGELARLKEQYRDQIELYAGIETDYYGSQDRTGLDYTIGSVHYLKMESGELLSVDYTPEEIERMIAELGSIRAVVERYYRLVADVALTQKPDILGHFDLITKLNADNRFFDPAEPWYRQAVLQTVEAAAQGGSIVEVNTGAISRGYRDIPYPSLEILREMKSRGIPVTISSDAHAAVHLDYAFDLAAQILQEAGYRSVMRLQQGRFHEISL